MRQKIFVVALSVMGLFIIYFGLESLNPSSVNVSAEKNMSPLERDTVEILDKIKDKTYEKYNIGTYNINSNVDNNSKEIDIEIIGSQEYYDSVKNEVKELVKNTIKSTRFEKFSVNVNKSKIDQIMSEELKETHSLINEITKTIHGNLSEYFPNQIDQVVVANTPPGFPPELSIEVKTLLNEQKPADIGKEMENKINIILEKKLFSNKLVKESLIKIHIYNKNEERIN